MSWPCACLALTIALLAAPIDATAARRSPSRTPAALDSLGHDPAIRAACEQIDGGDLLRIKGDFGTFEGFASGADSTGIFGLRDRAAPAGQAFTGQLEWGQIEAVEIGMNKAKEGAITGAVTMAGVGFAVGLAGAFILEPDDYLSSSDRGVVALSTVIGAAVGAGIGASMGAAKRVWRRIYPVRGHEPAPRSTDPVPLGADMDYPHQP